MSSGASLEGYPAQHCQTPAQPEVDAPETKFQVTQGALPVGINGSPGTLLHDPEAFGDKQKGGHGDDEDQAFETGGLTQFGLLQTE